VITAAGLLFALTAMINPSALVTAWQL